jgi:hypothetical protein
MEMLVLKARFHSSLLFISGFMGAMQDGVVHPHLDAAEFRRSG